MKLDSPRQAEFLQYKKMSDNPSKEKIVLFPSEIESHIKAKKAKKEGRMNSTAMSWKGKYSKGNKSKKKISSLTPWEDEVQ